MAFQELRKSIILVMISLSSLIASGVPQEKLQAVFVEKFAYFTEWPDSHRIDSSVIICLLDSSAVTDEIKAIYTQSFLDTPVEIIQIAPGDSIPFCHILFVAVDSENDIVATITALEELPVLTISNQKGCAEQGVIINLYVENGKVRFEINVTALKKSGLSMSYKLLQMAKIVRGTK